MSEKALQGLGCPRCGGMVPVPEGQAIVVCPYCEQRSVVSGERGVRRYQVPTRVDRAQAQTAYEKFLSSNMAIARDTRRKAQMVEAFLVHLPFWAAWGRGVAWAFGEQKVGSGDHQHYEPREKRAVKELSWNGVACDVGEFGVRRVSLEGRPLEPFNSDDLHRSGMVFEPVGSDYEALEGARRTFEKNVSGEVNLSRTSQLFTRILNPRLGVVYYPVWVMRYLYRQRAFQVVVDGFDGSVLYGKAPGNVLFRAGALVLGMAAGAAIAIDVPAAVLSASSKDTPVWLALGAFVVGVGIMIGGYRRFRYGEQYEYQRYKEKEESVFDLGIGGDEVKEILREVGRFSG
jgi:hypothetical protein